MKSLKLIAEQVAKETIVEAKLTAKKAIQSAVNDLLGKDKIWFGGKVKKVSVKKSGGSGYGYSVYLDSKQALDIQLYRDGVETSITNNVFWDDKTVDPIDEKGAQKILDTLLSNLGAKKKAKVTYSTQYSRSIYRGDYEAE